METCRSAAVSSIFQESRDTCNCARERVSVAFCLRLSSICAKNALSRSLALSLTAILTIRRTTGPCLVTSCPGLPLLFLSLLSWLWGGKKKRRVVVFRSAHEYLSSSVETLSCDYIYFDFKLKVREFSFYLSCISIINILFFCFFTYFIKHW